MITEKLQKLEVEISNRLTEREEDLQQSIRTRQNLIPLNIEIMSLRVAHPLVSAVVSVVEILTPRSSK